MADNKIKNENSTNIDKDLQIISSELEDGTTIITTTSESVAKKLIEEATYQYTSKEHLYSRYLKNIDSSIVPLTDEELNDLATNPQDDINKILKINGKIRYYINKDDLIGKVYETIEGNVNTDIKLNFKEVSKSNRNKNKERKRAEEILESFNDTINLKNVIRKSVPSTYTEGTYIQYLRKDKKGNYVVDQYPLGVALISSYELDGEPVVLFDVNELKTRLQDAGYKDRKGKNMFMSTMEEEIMKNYPDEVYRAYKDRERYVKLNPANCGVMRINNLNRQYGVSPIFRTFSPQIMLDIMANSDKNNASAKGKKIIVQILRKEMLGQGGDDFDSGKWMLAHSELMKAWKNPVVVYTAVPWVEDVKYVESKVEQIPIETINYYKNKILTALGISFTSPENKNSYVVAQINVNELLKTINKVTEQLEQILNKWYKLVLQDNNIDLNYCPNVQIIDSEMLDMELKLKLSDILFNKFGCSFKTSYELLGINFEDEKQRRIAENDDKLDEDVFFARQTAYTFSSKGKEDYGNDDKNAKTDENQNEDKTQQKDNKERYDNKLSSV